MSILTKEFIDWREYYYQLRQGNYYLNESNCAIIGFPVTPEEEPVAFLNIKKEEPLYERNNECKIIFQSGNDDELDEMHYGEDILNLNDIDTSKLATNVYLIVGGKLKPLYSATLVSKQLNLTVIDSKRQRESYLWSKHAMEGLGVSIDDIKPVAMSIDDYSGITPYYDCRPVLEEKGEKLLSFDEYDQLCSFRILSASDLTNFPKTWGIDVYDDELEGLEKVGYAGEYKLVVKLTDKVVENTPWANIIKPSDVDEKALILHIRELEGFRKILNMNKKKITSLKLLGLLEDGRAVFEANKLVKSYELEDIMKIFFAKYRL